MSSLHHCECFDRPDSQPTFQSRSSSNNYTGSYVSFLTRKGIWLTNWLNQQSSETENGAISGARGPTIFSTFSRKFHWSFQSSTFSLWRWEPDYGVSNFNLVYDGSWKLQSLSPWTFPRPSTFCSRESSSKREIFLEIHCFLSTPKRKWLSSQWLVKFPHIQPSHTSNNELGHQQNFAATGHLNTTLTKQPRIFLTWSTSTWKVSKTRNDSMVSHLERTSSVISPIPIKRPMVRYKLLFWGHAIYWCWCCAERFQLENEEFILGLSIRVLQPFQKEPSDPSDIQVQWAT